MNEKIIKKVSETEIKITKTIPEVIIPEKVEEEVVSLKDLKGKLGKLDFNIKSLTNSRDFPLSELAKIDKKIDDFNLEKVEIEALIAEAVKQGVN